MTATTVGGSGRSDTAGGGPSREKYWSELSQELQIERMRSVVKRAESTIRLLETRVRELRVQMREHSHFPNGQAAVLLKKQMDEYFETDKRASEDSDKVYF